MEKNVIVTDVNGNQISLTYPKRAKGLVKKNRAEYVSENTIRLLHCDAPDVFPHNDTEETEMSNVINFNAREFKLDESCKHNVGTKAFMTVAGRSAEVWEIGDWNWSWTQLICTKKLETNTDYVFRVAVTGGHNDTDDEVSQIIIFPQSDALLTEEQAWEDRMTFAIGKSRFEPVLSKRDKTGMLRVFEIPFNTGEIACWRILIVSQHAVARFFGAAENEAYEKLEDLTYEQWREERNQQLSNNLFGGNDSDRQCEIDLSGAVISSDEFGELIRKYISEGVRIDLSGAVIGGM